jgi:sulfoxide reductase heme-binding subunit YedZ
VAGNMSSNGFWYVSRGTGTVALVLFTFSLVLGILTHDGRAFPGFPRFVVSGLHRNSALLALLFLGIHIVTIVSDTFAKVGWLDVVVPFHSEFRPMWTGFGVVAFELFVAVIVTSLIRFKLGLRTWKLVHWSVYAAWPFAIAHSLGSGSDVSQSWMRLVAIVCIGAFVVAGLWRLTEIAPESR